MLKIYPNSKNYTCQVIKLPTIQKVEGLDNLVKVNVQGNDCLIGKESNPDELYLFFPAECQLSEKFVSMNNLYRHSEMNNDKTKKGFFEDNRRVKTLKFKGIISSGFVIPLTSLTKVGKINSMFLEVIPGDEFNEIMGSVICQKFIRPHEKNKGISNSKTKILDEIVDSKFAPEHMSTAQLMKCVNNIHLDDYIAVTYKLHGTSARYFNTLTKRKLGWIEKIARFFGVKIQEEEYNYVTGSRKVIKSIGFETLSGKKHYYIDDLWSKVGKEYFDGKLNEGECVYCEIVGREYPNYLPNDPKVWALGSEIQHGYSYGLNKPKVYIYRISNINTQGIEVDLSYLQMQDRTIQLGLECCLHLFYGKTVDFINKFVYKLDICESETIEKCFNKIFYELLLEQPSILDNTVIEEGFCIRVEAYPKPYIYKIKSKKFLLQEGVNLDKQITDIEEEQL